jgi:glutamate dehydrogenase (NADP+)
MKGERMATKMKKYYADFLENVKAKNIGQQEFYQAVEEVVISLIPCLEKNPVYLKEKILERIVIPDRTFIFRVPWTDDKGEIHVQIGYRVEFNNAIGPYKGGLRFHRSVNLSVLKFLGFEQIFKNSLTTLPMGGGKGGSDFDPRGRSDAEVMRFCQSFMNELHRWIGADIDVPAGDIGVGGREIGFMFGQFKKLTRSFEGVLTGKGLNWGGSLIRPEATGYGVVYFAKEMLKTRGTDFKGKTVAVSGFGNVSWGAVAKVNELGGKVVTISGPDGFIYDKDGIKDKKWEYMLELRASGKDIVEPYAKKFKADFHKGKRPWGVKADVCLPCATQNELNANDAKEIVKNKAMVVCEGANMPCTPEAIEMFLANKVMYAPGKASNAGGVACSGLEMTQNSMRLGWKAEEVDKRLHDIMIDIHHTCLTTAKKYGEPGNYMAGANIAGFEKVAKAMIDQGLV